jgi:hypothetical protein
MSRTGARGALGTIAVAALAALAGQPAAAQGAAEADVVVVVDTSTSMREPGMDPERTSLLVTKLLSDIAPGSLAVVRLLDLKADSGVLPSKNMGEFMPCAEDPSQRCERVEAATDWWASARGQKLGALVRPARADAAYKKQLDSHLAQRINNSLFDLALRSAQGVLDERRQARPAGASVPQTVIWLSDGRSEHENLVGAAVTDLGQQRVAVEAIVFGRGDTRLPRELGLPTHQVKTPAELMQAFAGAFRRIVQAPYEVDAVLAASPSFEMKRGVDEAWIVVYGDDTLSRVEVEGPDGPMAADYAADRWQGAGAYRVAYLTRPAAGRWTIRATGGDAGTAYAVVQRSSLAPVFVAPEEALSGVPTALSAGIRGGGSKEPLRDPEVLAEAELSVEVQGSTVRLHDDGREGDEVAGDGRFSGLASFRGFGPETVRLRLKTPLVDRTVEAVVQVGGRFVTTGEPVEVDLGRLGVGAKACKPLRFAVEHEGQVPLALDLLASLPNGHELAVRTPRGEIAVGREGLPVAPGDVLEVCLATGSRVASSEARGEPWLRLGVASSADPRQQVTIRLRWQVAGLSFWARWGWLILLILAILAVLIVIAGYVVPERLQPSLALILVPEREEIEEQSPQPVKQWRGVGIGFYRNARAHLHPDFRLSGNARGAVATLLALRGGTRVLPGKGVSLFREALDGGFEPVAPDGRTAQQGDVYRVGERGPFFRLTSRRGRG